MSKKKIYFLLPNLEVGGAERIMLGLINQLDKSIYAPSLILFNKEGPLLLDLDKKIPIVSLGVKRMRYGLASLLFFLFKNPADLVFSGYGEINAFLAPFIPLFRKTRFIARETNVVSKHIQRKEIQFLYRFYNNYHAIIAQSDDMALDLKENWNIKNEKINKINNPVASNALKNISLTAPYPVEFKPQQRNIVLIGSLTHRKGFDLMLYTCRYLSLKPYQVYIIGQGPEKDSLIKLKEKLNLNQVHFLGFKKDPYAYLVHADLFILSSRYEGFPNILLEAGACGCFSLSNDCQGGIREIIQPEVNGLIHNIEDFKGFAALIEQTFLKTHNKQKIQESIELRYNEKKIFAQYNALIKSTLNP